MFPNSCPIRLIKLLDVDLSWRLNKVSDGQRRRVQICMGLLKPYQVTARLADRSLPTCRARHCSLLMCRSIVCCTLSPAA